MKSELKEKKKTEKKLERYGGILNEKEKLFYKKAKEKEK